MKNITLTMKERNRAAILSKLAKTKKNKPTVTQLAECMGLSERHIYRLKARYKKLGPLGLAHRNRGRRSFRKMPRELEDKIVRLAQRKYKGFNDHHLTEKLNEVEGIKVSRQKVQGLLRERGIPSVRRRMRPKHRTRRERMPQEGLMLQTDGSEHDWLEGRGERLTLLGLVDDATNFVPTGFFDEEETTLGYLKLFYDTFSKYGLPASIYADRHMIFQTPREPTLEEQLQNKKPETQVGRALRELGVRLIPAFSSQAKGRIERTWGTFQDRLVSELRLANAKNKQEANAVAKQFVHQYNRRFTKKPANPTSAWRPIPKDIDLKQILCIKEQRIVANDNTVSWRGQIFQIPKSDIRHSFAKAKVEVRHLLNGEIQIFYKNLRIARFRTKIAPINGFKQPISMKDNLGYTHEFEKLEAA
jgi:transposase